MRLLVLLMVSMYCLCTYAQVSEDVFTIRNPYNVWLQPPAQQIFAGQAYRFKVKGIALRDVSIAKMNRAEVLLTDTDIVIIPQPVTNEPRYDSLELYIVKNGTPRRVLNHGFKVMKKPALVVTDTAAPVSRGFTNEIFLHWFTRSRQMFKSDKATVAQIKRSPDVISSSTPNVEANIVSYRMDINCGTGIEKFVSNSKAITPAMRTALNNVSAGCTIKLYDIQCIPGGSSNDVTIIGPYTIVVTE